MAEIEKRKDRKRSEETEASFVVFLTKHFKKKRAEERNPAIIMKPRADAFN